MSRTIKDTKQFAEEMSDKLNTIPACIGGIYSYWKKLRRRSRRAKEKEAVRIGKQTPKFKKTDEWD